MPPQIEANFHGYRETNTEPWTLLLIHTGVECAGTHLVRYGKDIEQQDLCKYKVAWERGVISYPGSRWPDSVQQEQQQVQVEEVRQQQQVQVEEAGQQEQQQVQAEEEEEVPSGSDYTPGSYPASGSGLQVTALSRVSGMHVLTHPY